MKCHMKDPLDLEIARLIYKKNIADISCFK